MSYGTSQAMADTSGEFPEFAAQPGCECATAAAALMCGSGHLLECHYPMNCEAARCSHWQRANPASVADMGNEDA